MKTTRWAVPAALVLVVLAGCMTPRQAQAGVLVDLLVAEDRAPTAEEAEELRTALDPSSWVDDALGILMYVLGGGTALWGGRVAGKAIIDRRRKRRGEQ